MNAAAQKPLLLILEEVGSWWLLEACLDQVDRPIYGIFSKLVREQAQSHPQIQILELPKDADELVQQMNRLGIESVFTGTAGWSDRICRPMFRMLKSKGISYSSFVDHWTWFRERFSEIKNEKNTGAYEFKPEHLYVVDELAKQKAVEAGFEPDLVSVIGHPGLEKIMLVSKSTPKGPSDVVGFVSEDFAGGDEMLGLPYGFDQFQVLSDLIELAKALHLKIVIRPHPEEDPKSFELILRDFAEICRLSPASKSEFFEEVGLVVGMQSMLLIEAALAGFRVISYQPGLDSEDFVGVSLGLCQGFKDFQSLKKAFQGPTTSRPSLSKDHLLGSADRMAQLLTDYS